MNDLELNIRLDVRGRDVPAEEVARRHELALKLLCTNGRKRADHRTDYVEQGRTVPCLVVWVTATEWTREELYAIAEQLEQDCIAAYWPDDQHGELIGPAAASWGPFNLDKFKRIDKYQALAEFHGFAWGPADTERYLAMRRGEPQPKLAKEA